MQFAVLWGYAMVGLSAKKTKAVLVALLVVIICLAVKYEHGFDYALLWRVFAVVAVLFAAFLYWNRRLRAAAAQRTHALRQEVAERKHLAAILEDTSDLVSTALPNGDLTYMNRAGRKLVGWGGDEDIRTKKIRDIHPEWASRIVEDEGIPAAIQSGVWEGETAILGPDGHEILVSQVITAHKSSEGKLQYFSTIMRDITERKKAEETLKDNESKLRGIFNQTFQLMGLLSLDGIMLKANQTALDFAGVDEEEVIGKPFWQTPWWNHSEIEQEKLRKAIKKAASGESMLFETSHPDSSGTIRTFEFSLKPIKDADGRIIYLNPEGRDITERKQAEESLLENENKYRTLYESLVVGVALLKDGVIVDCNEQLCRLMAYERKELIGHTPADHSPETQPDGRNSKEAALELVEAALAGAPQRFIWKHKRKDGVLIDTEVFLDVMTIGEEELIQAIMHDITERKRAEQALQQAYEELKLTHRKLQESQSLLVQTEKMSAMGTMVAGIAHELNNPLTAMLNFTAVCIEDTPREHRNHSILEDIQTQIMRCVNLVKDLLAFSHSGKGIEEEFQKMSCRDILDLVIRMLAYRIEVECVAITTEYDEATPDIPLRPNSMQQVFMNFIGNALDALAGSDKKEIHLDIHPEGEFLQISIADTGQGITSENLDKILEPFFTTKPQGKGTGLGLSISSNVIENHGGKLTCQSEPGEGTKFTILLPIEGSVRTTAEPVPATAIHAAT